MDSLGRSSSISSMTFRLLTSSSCHPDRTNVVQSALAKAAINRQLRIAGVIKDSETIENYGDFMHLFRNGSSRSASSATRRGSDERAFLRAVWADHADTISQPYSSTGALKTDFTRTGKRTKMGAVQDGVNSILRYVNNNFFDGSKQVSLPLPPLLRQITHLLVCRTRSTSSLERGTVTCPARRASSSTVDR